MGVDLPGTGAPMIARSDHRFDSLKPFQHAFEGLEAPSRSQA
jgi:hypothetical protein